MNADLLMPADAQLACMTNYLPFEAALDTDPGSKPHRRAVAEAKRVCASCDFRRECLNVNATEPGVIAGMTADERAKLGVAA